MSPKKTKQLQCAECMKLRDRTRPAVRHVDGRIDVVCNKCWNELEYEKYMYFHRMDVAS